MYYLLNKLKRKVYLKEIFFFYFNIDMDDNKCLDGELMLFLKVREIRFELIFRGLEDCRLGRGKDILIRNSMNEVLKLGMSIL